MEKTHVHNNVFDPIKDCCVDALRSIAESIDDDYWVVEYEHGHAAVEEGEWKTRDGFISFNSGNVGFMYMANAFGLYFAESENPYVQKWVDSIRSDILESTRKLDDCPSGIDDNDLMAWMADNHPEIEERELEAAQESTPFIRGSFLLSDDCLDSEELTEDTVFSLVFQYGFNDDYGYGREWCQGGYYGPNGFGNRNTVYKEIRFTLKDMEWLKDYIAGIPEIVESTPGSTKAKLETVTAPNAAKHITDEV